MARRASNADRIARAAAEAEAAAAEKKQKKAAKKTAKKRTTRKRKPKEPERLKIVWAVGIPGKDPVSAYEFKDHGDAVAEAAERGGEYRVIKHRVPMEPPPAAEAQ